MKASDRREMNTAANRAYQRGRSAYNNQKPLSANPFTHETTRQSEHNRRWAKGWNDAREEWVKATNACFARDFS